MNRLMETTAEKNPKDDSNGLPGCLCVGKFKKVKGLVVKISLCCMQRCVCVHTDRCNHSLMLEQCEVKPWIGNNPDLIGTIHKQWCKTSLPE